MGTTPSSLMVSKRLHPAVLVNGTRQENRRQENRDSSDL
jgi:hypothetical protein